MPPPFPYHEYRYVSRACHANMTTEWGWTSSQWFVCNITTYNQPDEQRTWSHMDIGRVTQLQNYVQLHSLLFSCLVKILAKTRSQTVNVGTQSKCLKANLKLCDSLIVSIFVWWWIPIFYCPGDEWICVTVFAGVDGIEWFAIEMSRATQNSL